MFLTTFKYTILTIIINDINKNDLPKEEIMQRRENWMYSFSAYQSTTYFPNIDVILKLKVNAKWIMKLMTDLYAEFCPCCLLLGKEYFWTSLWFKQ